MKFGLSEKTLQKMHAVFSQYPQVEEAILYGSRARGDYRNGSDIDLTLHGGEDLTHWILSKIATDLDDQLLPYMIDLSIHKNIKDTGLLQQIAKVGVTFYKKKETPPES